MPMAAQRILLVEDDPEQANLFARVLTMKGYDVVATLDSEAALARLREDAFDLVLLDWDLPGIKGDAFIYLLKVEHPEVKTMLFSNHSDIGEAARASGADAWMVKSDGIVRLREIIAELLQEV
ncbi:MAG: response regulator [Armatimonadota bacterium]